MRYDRAAMFDSIESVQQEMAGQRYFADRAIATTVFLAAKLGKPLFLEGEAGVGKTELAKVLASILDTRLIRLQCYEGLDASHALYEWNYPKQLLRIKLGEASGSSVEEIDKELFSEEYLVRRPLLDAITADGARAPVLLIDEIDRVKDTNGLASFLKINSSRDLRFMLVGIADDVASLFSDRASVARQAVPTRVERMSKRELKDIIARAMHILNEQDLTFTFTFTDGASTMVAHRAGGFPWFVHIIGGAALQECDYWEQPVLMTR